MRLESPRGPVTVRTGPPGQVTVRAWVEAGSAGSDPLDLRRGEEGLEITVSSPGPEGPGPRPRVRFELLLPPASDLVLRVGEGDLSVEGVGGRVRMETDSGDLTARSCGDVAAGSVNGDIALDSCRSAEANTVSGTIRIRGVEGPVTATCVSGSIYMEEMVSPSVRASTTGGDIRFMGSVLEGGTYRLSSHSGDIAFTARGGRGFVLNLSTFSGSIAIPLDVTLTSSPISRRSLRGRWGDAAASVELDAFSGNIRLEASARR
ncbi:MAG: DUF4097 family beta strand repeat-containing protein [bacterium]